MRKPISVLPGSAAALFIDLQEEHRQDRRYLVEGFDLVIANVRRLQAAARAELIGLYHFAYIVDLASEAAIAHHPVTADGKSAFSDKDDPLTAVCPEVAPAAGEPLVIKSQASAFAPGFELELRQAGIEWLFVAGVWTEACVDATVKDAVRQGFRVVLVKDACGSGTEAMHRIGILNMANRLYGGVVTDTDGACRLMAGEAVEVWTVEGAVPLRFTFQDAAALYDAL